MCFVDNRIFADAEKLPWKLCKGSILQNLRQLKHMDGPPGEMVADQMWQLLNMNYPEVCLVDVVKSMAQLPWSSIGCEQGHVAASIIKRFHPDIQENNLKCRAFIYMLQPMISEGDEWSRVATMQREIDKLIAKDPLKFSGRQLFLQESIQKLKLKDGDYYAKQKAKEMIMATHSEQFY